MTAFEIFKNDVLEGLSSVPKFLSSKYFYDDKGSQIFQKIMDLPEYYLTDCELEIFENHKSDILAAIDNEHKAFDLIEFGAGDGYKTQVLISYLIKQGIRFRYLPVDISEESNTRLYRKLKGIYPSLEIHPVSADYFTALRQIRSTEYPQRVILFLGSNIGNFNEQESINFFQEISDNLDKGDKMMTGFDLKKDISIILPAYNDSQGITSDFNLNLLHRINRELGADFNVKAFSHKPFYDEDEGTAKSFITSEKDQQVNIQALGKTIHFKKGESIFTEISQKYDLDMINHFANETGFTVSENFFDNRSYFVDSLWERV